MTNVAAILPIVYIGLCHPFGVPYMFDFCITGVYTPAYAISPLRGSPSLRHYSVGLHPRLNYFTPFGVILKTAASAKMAQTANDKCSELWKRLAGN